MHAAEGVGVAFAAGGDALDWGPCRPLSHPRWHHPVRNPQKDWAEIVMPSVMLSGGLSSRQKAWAEWVDGVHNEYGRPQ